jgi:hypothetical protein
MFLPPLCLYSSFLFLSLFPYVQFLYSYAFLSSSLCVFVSFSLCSCYVFLPSSSSYILRPCFPFILSLQEETQSLTLSVAIRKLKECNIVLLSCQSDRFHVIVYPQCYGQLDTLTPGHTTYIPTRCTLNRPREITSVLYVNDDFMLLLIQLLTIPITWSDVKKKNTVWTLQAVPYFGILH